MDEHTDGELNGAPSIERMTALLLELSHGVNAHMFRSLGDKVIAGPFVGMSIPLQPPWDDGNSSTKLLGTYEWELQESVLKAVSRQPDIVVNVGCAEGYYAIGLARLLPAAKVFALDVSDKSLACCEEYAKRNGVLDRMTLWNGCRSAEELVVPGPGRLLYVLDCESYECDLLDKTRCPPLAHADIIVECHDFMVKAESPRTITELLSERFRDTHDVERIEPGLPPLAKYAFPERCSSALAVLAVTEKRPMPTRWLACWAK